MSLTRKKAIYQEVRARLREEQRVLSAARRVPELRPLVREAQSTRDALKRGALVAQLSQRLGLAAPAPAIVPGVNSPTSGAVLGFAQEVAPRAWSGEDGRHPGW